MKIERVKIRRVADGEDGAAWARALGDAAWVAGARVLKDEAGSGWVRRAVVNGRDVVVKCRLLNSAARRFKSAMGLGHGQRHWRGALELTRRNIATGRPIALMHGWIDDGPAELLVLEFVSGRTVLEWIAAARTARGAEARARRAITRRLAELEVLMSVRGVMNRDHKASNLVVTTDTAGEYSIAIIDCVGVRPTRFSDGQRMQASLVTEAIGCGVAPTRPMVFRYLRDCREVSNEEWGEPEEYRSREQDRAAIRSDWEIVSGMVKKHGDPRPKVNPLRAGVG
jgi:hypothetical protein